MEANQLYTKMIYEERTHVLNNFIGLSFKRQIAHTAHGTVSMETVQLPVHAVVLI